ncbi:MAG: LigC protein, partial [bacterium]|nr:LigC protein [bacterium]
NLTKSIAAGGYFLVACPAYSNAATPDQTYGGGRLSSTGGAVGVRDGAQQLIDSVGYGDATNMFVEGAAAAAPPVDQSIARTPNGIDSGHNDSDFAVATTPTPRASN